MLLLIGVHRIRAAGLVRLWISTAYPVILAVSAIRVTTLLSLTVLANQSALMHSVCLVRSTPQWGYLVTTVQQDTQFLLPIWCSV